MGQYRKNRLAELMRQEISDIMRLMKDPRLGLASVVKVQVDADMTSAKVFVSCFGGDTEQTMQVLTKSAGYIRSELAKKLRTRTVPELSFISDHSIEEGFRISEILNDYRKERPDNPVNEESEEPNN